MLAKNANTIVQTGLIYNVDLNNPTCWAVTQVNNLPATVFKGLPSTNISLKKAVTLQDSGLTLKETGVAITLRDTSVSDTHNGFNLTEVYKTDVSQAVTSVNDSAGVYATLNDSYLQGFFKLEGYDYQLLPPRYASGMTIETSIKVDLSSLVEENIFLFMGTRAENKFYKDFGIDLAIPQADFTTFEGIALAPDHIMEPELGVEDNALAFLLDKSGRIGYKFVANDLTIESEFSENRITHNGWLNISFSYKPCEIITDNDLLDCSPQRNGTLSLFVNGLVFHEFDGFPEFIFKPMSTQSSKQIGVPYNISWGGGTRGLRNSISILADADTDNLTDVSIDKNDYILSREFDSYLKGGIQTLRIYNRPLTVLEARVNHNHLASRYGLTIVKGGRATPQISW